MVCSGWREEYRAGGTEVCVLGGERGGTTCEVTRGKSNVCYRWGLYSSLTSGVCLTVHYSAVDIFVFPSLLYSVQNYFAINIEPFSKDKLVHDCCFRRLTRPSC